MLSTILFFIAAMGVWKTAQYVSTFVDEQWLLEPQKEKLRERFETWWASVAQAKPRYFAVALARAASGMLTNFFGKRLFSKRAFVRSSAIASALLGASLVLTSLSGAGVSPWKEFDNAIRTAKSVYDRTPQDENTEAGKASAEVSRAFRDAIKRFGTTQWKVVHSAVFLLALVFMNSMAFFLSVGFSRLVLQEIVASGRIFSACALLVLNFFLVVSSATVFLLLLTILAYPVFWFMIPAVFVLSSLSPYWFLAFGFGGGIAAWAFGNPSLQVVSLIAVLPCVMGMLICGASIAALANRKRFHWLCCEILLRCTYKKPLSFIIGFVGFIAVIIAYACWAVRTLL